MLRNSIPEALRVALKQQDKRCISTVRLIMAALKDRDIAARGKGDTEGISDDEILQMLQTMVKQRRESIQMYEDGGRKELAEQEAKEITIIERFLPQQLDEEQINLIVEKTINEIGADSLKDMGHIMSELRNNYAGQMDFSKASGLVKQKLSNS
ncbi:MAG: glutamyl-tRNA amidotransferase [Rhodospirillaceae bacterium]|nr:glutamyl-tRNA amidotransferase [Rhodospirillaceae bacterium]|tara:strand:- start:11296 stop:11757 length:462 start_codon:yes stop_codon:yes gene_type:complete